MVDDSWRNPGVFRARHDSHRKWIDKGALLIKCLMIWWWLCAKCVRALHSCFMRNRQPRPARLSISHKTLFPCSNLYLSLSLRQPWQDVSYHPMGCGLCERPGVSTALTVNQRKGQQRSWPFVFACNEKCARFRRASINFRPDLDVEPVFLKT